MNVEKLVNQGLDLRAALGIPVRQVIPWVVAVMFITYMGYSGVICITPMAWLMALRVGIQVSVTSKSAERSNRLREAGVAGGHTWVASRNPVCGFYSVDGAHP